MNEDGTMARKKALIDFSKKHNLKIGTIADLINYRIFNEQTVKRIERKSVKTEFGKFNLILYKDLIFDETHIVLQKGKITKNSPTLVSCLLYTSPSPRDATLSRMPSSA